MGSTRAGYSLRPWSREVAAVPAAIAALSDAPVLLVQSGLYAHAGYSARVQLLAPHTLNGPANAGATILLAPAIGAYPFERPHVRSIAARPGARTLDDGLIAVQK